MGKNISEERTLNMSVSLISRRTLDWTPLFILGFDYSVLNGFYISDDPS